MKIKFHWLQLTPSILFFILFLIIPLLSVMVWSFYRNAGYWIEPAFTTEAYRKLIQVGRYVTILQTLKTAAIATTISIIIGFPVVYLASFKVPEKYKAPMLFLMILPFTTSYVVRTFAWRLILGRYGLINNLLTSVGAITNPLEGLLFSEFAVDIGLISAYSPFVIFFLFICMNRIPRSLLEASHDLGANIFQTLRYVILPLSAPGLFAGAILEFGVILGDNLAVPFLGGGAIATSTMLAQMIRSMLEAFEFTQTFAVSTVLIIGLLVGLAVGSILFKIADLFKSVYG